MKASLSLIILLYFCVASAANAGEVRASLQEAEKIADQYMRYMFSGKAEKLVKLTHPQVIDSTYEFLLNSYQQAKKDKKEGEFTQAFGAKLSGMISGGAAPLDVYVQFIRAAYNTVSDHGEDTKAVQDMVKTTQINIVSSKFINKNIAEVAMAFGVVGGEDKGTLRLQLFENKWKVVGDAE